MKNKFLMDVKKRNEELVKQAVNDGFLAGMQFSMDCIVIMLKSKDIMGSKRTFGDARIVKFCEDFRIVSDHFIPALTRNDSADVLQEEMDKCLMQAYGKALKEDFSVFPERYPLTLSFDYKTGKWK